MTNQFSKPLKESGTDSRHKGSDMWEGEPYPVYPHIGIVIYK